MAFPQFQRDAGSGPAYSNGYRLYDYASDPSTLRYKQFSDEAARLGITDPNQIHNYALRKQGEWGAQHGITDADIRRGKIGVGAIGLAGGAAYGLGAAGAGGAAAGAGEAGAGAGIGAGAGTAASAGADAELAAAMGYGPSAAGEIAGEIGGGAAGGMDATGALQGGGTAADVGGETIAGGAGPGTALSRIFSGGGSTPDWLNVGGNLLGTGLGIYGSRQASNAYGNLANQYMQFGAPSRARYEASMSPGFDPTTIPGYSGALDTASRGLLARLSASGGNPYGNPSGLLEANRQLVAGTALPAIQEYQRLNAGTGGYSGFNAAAPATSAAQIGAQGGLYNAIGSGVAGLFNPQPSLADTLRGLNVGGLS